MAKRKRMNISLTKEENELIKKLAKEEERPYSRQIVYMTNFYIKNNKKNNYDADKNKNGKI
jgi:hypothetical protein